MLLEAEMLELAIERRAADPQTARHLGHLAAVVRDGETNRLGLELLERPDMAGGVGQGEAVAILGGKSSFRGEI